MRVTLGIVWTETLVSVWFPYWILFDWFKWAVNLKQSGVVWIMSATGKFEQETNDLSKCAVEYVDDGVKQRCNKGR